MRQNEIKEVQSDRPLKPNETWIKEGGYVGQTTVSNPKLPQGGSSTGLGNTSSPTSSSNSGKAK